MAFARARALRTLQSTLRQRAVPRVSAPGRTQLLQRRYASGGGHDSHAPGSDLPWALGAVIVTIPSCWYLWPDSSHADAGHHGGHDEHDEHAEEGAEEKEGEQDGEQADEAPAEEAASSDAQPEEKEEGKAEEGGEESKPTEDESKDGEEGKSEDAGEAQPESGEESQDSGSSDDAPADAPKGTSGKGRMNADAAGATSTKSVQENHKGGSTIRIDSNARKELGGNSEDPEAMSRNPKKGQGDMATKQSGLSNTPTRHSLQIDQDPTKSTKSEGAPETAKTIGTVDPNRAAK